MSMFQVLGETEKEYQERQKKQECLRFYLHWGVEGYLKCETCKKRCSYRKQAVGVC